MNIPMRTTSPAVLPAVIGSTQPITGYFDPIFLNPPLLLDGALGVLGEYQEPKLDLDGENFWTPTVGAITSVTRAGNATVMDSSGDIVDVAENTGRIDYSLGYAAALIEPSAVQSVGKTDFSSGWSASGTTNSAGAGYRGRASLVLRQQLRLASPRLM